MPIDSIYRHALRPFSALIVSVSLLGLYSATAMAAEVEVKLAGTQEVPPNSSSASGLAKITIGTDTDRTLSGSVTTTGMSGTAAHIHEGAAGVNGPVIIPLTKNGDTYALPPGIKLTDSFFASLQLGNLYINVHSSTFPGGEIRGQIVLPTFR